MFCAHCGNALPKGMVGGNCPLCGKSQPNEAAEFSREGRVLMIPAGKQLPSFCIKCNAPAQGNTKRVKLSWHPPAISLLALLGLLPYALVAMMVSKKATLELPFCRKHRSAWTPLASAGLLLILLGTGVVATLIVLDANTPNGKSIVDSSPLAPYACAFIPTAGLAGLVMLAFGRRRVTPKRIDEFGNAWVKGVAPEFLDEHVSGIPPAPHQMV